MFPSAFKSLSDQQRHDYILQTYVLNKEAAESRKHRRDIDVIRDNHRFLWSAEDEARGDDSWEIRMARRYYEKLFKEYCIVELARYKENKVAMRWRTEAEVVSGKGQFECGTRKCTEREELRSWEVNFAYQEQGERKNALVKVRLCAEHSRQLNYHSKKREIKRLKHSSRHKSKDEPTKKKEKKMRRGSREKSKRKTTDEEDTREASPSQALSNESTSVSAEPPTDEVPDEELDVPTEDVWSKKLEVVEVSSREADFQSYLEDLLL